jgi:hypothetical protein
MRPSVLHSMISPSDGERASRCRSVRYPESLLPAGPSWKADESERVQRASDGAASACLGERDMWVTNNLHLPVPVALVSFSRTSFGSGPQPALSKARQPFRAFPYSLSGIWKETLDLPWPVPLPARPNEYRRAKSVFQFATVRHLFCGAYLSVRSKRGKRLARNDCLPHHLSFILSGRKPNVKEPVWPLTEVEI